MRANEKYKYEGCTFNVSGPIATFTISAPDTRNSISDKMREGMRNAVHVVREDDDIRVLVITGDPDGKAFCSGLNVKRLAKVRGAARRNEQDEPGATPPSPEDKGYTPDSQWYRMAKMQGAFEGSPYPHAHKGPSHSQYVWWKENHLRGGFFVNYKFDLLRLPKPVIAMVNGPCVGEGCDLPFYCDIVIASEQAFFLWNYIHRGMIAYDGGAYILPRLCGYHRALEILMLGERISARQVYEWGIINHVVPHDELNDFTYELARRLAGDVPPMHIGMLKYAVQRGFNDFVNKFELFQDEIILPYNILMRGANDSAEGPKAFVEKRKPHYTGT